MEYTGKHTTAQRVMGAVMIPLYSAGFVAFLACARPTKASAQEAPAAVSETIDYSNSQFPGIDCLVNDLKKISQPGFVVDCEQYLRSPEITVADTATTESAANLSSYGSATDTAKTEPAQPALPVQPAPSAATGTLETTVSGTATPTASAPAPYTPKRSNGWKTVGQIFTYGSILYFGIKSLTKKSSSSPANTPAAPAGGPSSGIASDANDPSLDNSFQGDEDVQDEVTTVPQIRTW